MELGLNKLELMQEKSYSYSNSEASDILNDASEVLLLSSLDKDEIFESFSHKRKLSSRLLKL